MFRIAVSFVLAALLVSCTSEKKPEAAPPVDKTAKVTPAADTHVHDVACGCTLEEAGKKCSEWIKVDGKFVQFAGDIGLGSMPFCGKKDVKVRVAGAVKDGKYVATSKVELVQ